MKPQKRGIQRWRLALSTACFISGAVLLVWPLFHTAVSDYAAGKVQAEALAAWDHPAEQPARAVESAMVLEVPRLSLRRIVPDGATVQHLKQYGVGHISWTAFPPTNAGALTSPVATGSVGVVAGPGAMLGDHSRIVGIAGHRTTYGAPFFRIGELSAGDSIVLLYGGRRYTYRVDRRVTTQPGDSDVLDGDNDEIALVTCTPPLSAALRLIVFGRLEGITAAAAAR
jgi:LPXTG-site transpeptidase (sortase) family protein